MSEEPAAADASVPPESARGNIFGEIVERSRQQRGPLPLRGLSVWKVVPFLWCFVLLLFGYPVPESLGLRIALTAGSVLSLAALLLAVRGWWLLNYTPLWLMIGFLTAMLWLR